MKKILFLFITFTFSTLTLAIDIYECNAQTGLMGATTTKVRLAKESTGYSLYITASSDDIGPYWEMTDQKISDNLNCKFSIVSNALYCVGKSGQKWTSVRAENIIIHSIDQINGNDITTKYIEIIISGNNKELKKFPNSVFNFAATTCTSK